MKKLKVELSKNLDDLPQLMKNVTIDERAPTIPPKIRIILSKSNALDTVARGRIRPEIIIPVEVASSKSLDRVKRSRERTESENVIR